LFDAEPWGFHREASYVERGFYGEQLGRALELFPRDQVLVLRSDDLRADPGPALASVRAFLDLPKGKAPRAREVHVGRGMDGGNELTDIDIAHLRQIYARDEARLADLIGVRFG
jgi:hypothetical protein